LAIIVEQVKLEVPLHLVPIALRVGAVHTLATHVVAVVVLVEI
jgi:hypothetical protein